MCQIAFFLVAGGGTNASYNRVTKRGQEGGKKEVIREADREMERIGLRLPLQGHLFCWIKYFSLIKVAFLSSFPPFSSFFPSPSPLQLLPLPLLFFTSHSTSPPPPPRHHPASLALPPFWGAADAVSMATIGSMFVWYVCDPLITAGCRLERHFSPWTAEGDGSRRWPNDRNNKSMKGQNVMNHSWNPRLFRWLEPFTHSKYKLQ